MSVVVDLKSVTVIVNAPPANTIEINQKRPTIVVNAAFTATFNIIFQNFSFTATEGQSVFTLPTAPPANAFILVVINGTTQNKLASDFTISGATLTLSEGVNAGDTIYGIYQK